MNYKYFEKDKVENNNLILQLGHLYRFNNSILKTKEIINDIEDDFKKGLMGIKKLPVEAKFGVFMAYRYYNQLLKKLKQTPALEIKNARVRVPNLKKIELLTRSFVKYQLNLM